jgi:LPPG:FO 2-phospho-L-lactate transferase
MGRLEALGDEAWFRLGDRDLATHLWRSDRLRAGMRPTEVALAFRAALGFGPTILPMADEPVRTEIRTGDGWLEFQEYFVRRHQAPEVYEVRFRGIDAAHATDEVLAAIAGAERVVLAPSNPIVSLGPLLAVPGIRSALDAARRGGTPVVGLSGIVGGRALKGPADRMLASLGSESSALGVARLLRDVLDAFVIDEQDRDLAPAIAALGLRVHVADTIMSDDAARAKVASEVLSA